MSRSINKKKNKKVVGKKTMVSIVGSSLAILLMVTGCSISKGSEQNASNVTTESSQSESPNNESGSGSGYKDGTYTGSASGFKGDVTVNVVVSGGNISNIKIVSTNDDREFFQRAESVIDEILNSQSTDVSVVSGATYSSNGIIDAVNNALESAK